MKNRNMLVGGIAIIVLIVVFGLTMIPKSSDSDFDWGSIENFDGKMTVYKSSACGCCGLYTDYVQKKSNLKVTVVEVFDVSPVKQEHNIPTDLQSCHTSVIGDYFVEGHIPLEAIAKLMTEEPDIAGIALPGMPPGSPGMPGAKRGLFVIYAVNEDGSYEEFMKL